MDHWKRISLNISLNVLFGHCSNFSGITIIDELLGISKEEIRYMGNNFIDVKVLMALIHGSIKFSPQVN